MDSFKNVLGKQMLVLEGAMGTMLQKAGLSGDGAPEVLNLIEPDSIARIHSFYRLAGADCAITNTFGANRIKLAHYNSADLVEEINRKAVAIARKGAAPYVLADMGPTGLVLGTQNSAMSAQADADARTNIDFDLIYDIFSQQARALASAQPDAFLLETFTDIAEIRCAIIACKDAAPDLPIIALVSLGENGRMELSGTDAEAAAVILESLGVDAIGLNCGLGPDQLEPLARLMHRSTSLPVVVQPNAGMPTLDASGNTIFPGTAEEMGAFAAHMRDIGVSAIGSCCGSDPEFTAAIADEISQRPCTKSIHATDFGLRIASAQQALTIGKASAGSHPIRAIGERINPTGKPQLKEQLTQGKMTLVRELAAQQQIAGADILDVNVGVAGIDEPATLAAAVQAVSSSFHLPIAIDTTNPQALETALKAYPGKALVNSVTGEQRSLDAVLPLVARYGAAVVVLALDDDGISNTAQGRLEVVRKVRDAARKQGISDDNLIVDSLVMAAAADPQAPQVTLEAMRFVHSDLNLSTVLGISNVSHGLPNRALLNAAFLTAATNYGLDAAIVDPNNQIMIEAIRSANVERSDTSVQAFLQSDSEQNQMASRSLKDFQELLTEALKPQHVPHESNEAAASVTDPAKQLAHAIILGDCDGAPMLVDQLISDGQTPSAIIEDILTPAIQGLGAGFADGTVFLPQLMVAADAMKVAVNQAKTYMPKVTSASQGTSPSVIFATVKGDIHSIGKDICCSLLESQGVRVLNLGVDVPTATIVDAVRDEAASAVCLSALMTTTLPAMVDTVQALNKAYPDLPVFLGGAVVTLDWAQAQKGLYEPDAPALATAIVKLIKST